MRIVTALYLLYLAAPIAMLAVGSFGESWTNTLFPTGLTTRWYEEVYNDPSFRRAFVTSLKVVLGGDPATIGGFIFSPAGLGFAYAYYLIPRVVMLMLPVLANFDYAQMQAAESLGASRLRAVLEVMLPQILPALVTTYSVVAAVAIGAYGTALALVGTQVAILPLVLYSKISETGSDFPAAAAASVILMGLCCLVILLAELAGHRRR
ncbi:ABC transporter permease [Oceanibaculum indicum]|uniref:Putative spermidine/putrescine transport system permease protein n=1 Tax=Oceanibaculum indicum TaxID=526216 RepID=A0A420WN26_9PROT|nr:ABC transporter permease subunit [Oceanibaculum indicum]RKQ72296.1 putative spermidine/putrescine transport system permease protein [Oceanibaculum indicum]